MGKFSFVKSSLNSLLTCINDKDFKQKYVNDDGSIKQEFIDIVYPKIQEALGSKSNSVPEPLPIKESGIGYNDQLKKAKEYISSILSKVKYDSDDWKNFVKSINNAINDIGQNGNINPYTLFPMNRVQSSNILSNTTFHIWNRTPKDKAQLYMDKLPPIKSAISIIEDNFNLKKDKLENDIAERKKYLEGMKQEIDKMKKEVKQTKDEKAQAEYDRDKALKGVKIAKEGFDYVVGGIGDIKDNSKVQNAALGELLKKNKSDILNDVALRLAGDPNLKKNIRKIKGDLKAANPSYSDGDINYIITKALSENERYLKTVAANPDLFERDMSNDTIQKENEQFQSKLRQQNLRYILPKFIERREKLVENTLNPNLLKGAFAI